MQKSRKKEKWTVFLMKSNKIKKIFKIFIKKTIALIFMNKVIKKKKIEKQKLK